MNTTAPTTSAPSRSGRLRTEEHLARRAEELELPLARPRPGAPASAARRSLLGERVAVAGAVNRSAASLRRTSPAVDHDHAVRARQRLENRSRSASAAFADGAPPRRLFEVAETDSIRLPAPSLVGKLGCDPVESCGPSAAIATEHQHDGRGDHCGGEHSVVT